MNTQSPLHEEKNRFTAYGDDYVCVNNIRYTGNLAVFPDRIIANWTPNTFATLSMTDFEHLAAMDTQVILLGTGKTQRFPESQLLQPLIARQQALEVMTTQAACRTFNLLAEEGRQVAAVLLMA